MHLPLFNIILMEMILVGVKWDGYLDYIFILGKLMEEHNANQAKVIVTV